MVTAVVMVGGPGGDSESVRWVQGARRAACRDLLGQLARQPLVGRIVLVTPDPEGLVTQSVDRVITSEEGSIHVGQELARIAREEKIDRLFYAGGGALPLLPDESLARVIERLAKADRLVITNNQFASDWAGVAPAAALASQVTRLPRDNMLGWVLSTEVGMPIETFPASAASRLDIDTPLDLLALRLHPATYPHLRNYLEGLPLDLSRLRAALEVLRVPASRVFIAGRIAPEVWSALNKVAQCWLRVVAEERGMVSSGRQGRGEVYSFVAAHVEAVGMQAFFESLAEWADVAFLDTRVLLAHHGRWPDVTARFASDLGQIEQIGDDWLQTFTAHAVMAPLPIVLGGHGLMSGVIYALVDLLSNEGAG